MIPKKPAPDLIRGCRLFGEDHATEQILGAKSRFNPNGFRSKDPAVNRPLSSTIASDRVASEPFRFPGRYPIHRAKAANARGMATTAPLSSGKSADALERRLTCAPAAAF